MVNADGMCVSVVYCRTQVSKAGCHPHVLFHMNFHAVLAFYQATAKSVTKIGHDE